MDLRAANLARLGRALAAAAVWGLAALPVQAFGVVTALALTIGGKAGCGARVVFVGSLPYLHGPGPGGDGARLEGAASLIRGAPRTMLGLLRWETSWCAWRADYVTTRAYHNSLRCFCRAFHCVVVSWRARASSYHSAD
ncbi:MAG TPA: hypothetical protein DEP35_15430 [Deltaproteobacteria bacterium]|nr:hypothetical protein [Deltaproteobacteria bacterium]